MSQMVLPQNLPKTAPSESANSAASNRTGKEKSGDSAFDAVSRSEQKRLEAKEAKDAKEARESKQSKTADQKQDSKASESPKSATDKPETDTAAEPRSASSEGTSADDSNVREGQAIAANQTDVPVSPENADPLLMLDGAAAEKPFIAELASASEESPVTFAGLQALLALPADQTGKLTAGQPASGQNQPFLQSSVMSMTGMPGNGKNTVMTLQSAGQNGQTSTMALSEALLAGVTGDGNKASDTSILQTAVRFQGALESASSQSNVVNTPRMAPDASVLRGYTTSIDVPVSHAEWGDKMAGKLTWLTARNMSVAEIHLTPPDMGPMEVRVQVQQDQANITVHSANPAVRDQLELHSHRLRDMLSEQGLSLENFDVSDSGRDQAGDGEAGGNGQSGEGLMADAEADDDVTSTQSLDLSWKGEVDIFA